MQQLIPAPARPTTVEEAYAAALGEHSDRPWVALTMVSSIDGSVAVDGASGGLSSDHDSAVLLQMRAVADVIVVGAGTARGEGYGPPSKQGQRIGLVTRSGSVDTSTRLFESGAGFVITTETAPIDGDVDVVRSGDSEVDLRGALTNIGELCPGTRTIQLEGGPTLNAAFAAADLVDELNINTSPNIVGGGGPRLLTGGSEQMRRYELVQMLVDDESFVFSRWKRRAPTSP